MRRLALALAFAALAQIAAAQTARIEVASGVDAGPVQSAAGVVALAQGGNANPVDLVAMAQTDYARILAALYAQGHYGGTVSIKLDGREAALIGPFDVPETIRDVVVLVEPGPVFAFGALTIGPLPPETTLPASLAAGAPAASGVITEAVTAAIAAWRDAGHPLAAVASQRITARHSAAVLDLDIRLDPGPLATIGPLNLANTSRVSPERIRAIAGLSTGTTYAPVLIDEAANRLRQSGAFSSVAITEGTALLPDGGLPLTAELADAPPRRLGYGIEYDSSAGLGLSAFWMHRNLLGGAERLRLDGAVTGIGGAGQPDAALSAELRRPATFSPRVDLTARVALDHRIGPDGATDDLTLGASLTRRIWRDLNATAGVELRAAHEVNAFGSRNYVLAALPVTGVLDRRDNALDPHSGFYADLHLTPFALPQDGALGVRLMAEGRYYRPLGDSLILAVRGLAGSVAGVDILTAPDDYLFLSGGGGSLRGISYQSLGVEVTQGPITALRGGRSMLGASLELRADIAGAWGAVGFLDWAMVGPDPIPGAGDVMAAGAGFGIRYDTGIGPIRLDVATPVIGANAFGDVQIYLGIGQSF